MTTTTATRPNRYAGRCVACGHHVAAGAGQLVGNRFAGWGAQHHPGTCPDAPAPAETPEAKAGFYVRDDRVFQVVISKSSGKPYAKEMVVTDGHGKWEYAPGTARDLSALTPLTAAEAARLGHFHGVCMICGADLSDGKRKGPDGLTSIERGIGPVCAAKL